MNEDRRIASGAAICVQITSASVLTFIGGPSLNTVRALSLGHRKIKNLRHTPHYRLGASK